MNVFQDSIMTRRWEPGVSYSVGEVLEYQGQRYKVIQGHFSQVSVLSAQHPTFRSDSHREMTATTYHRATGPQELRPLHCSSPWAQMSITNTTNNVTASPATSTRQV